MTGEPAKSPSISAAQEPRSYAKQESSNHSHDPARGRGSTGRGGNLVAPAPPQSQPGRTNRARCGFAGTTAHSSDHSPDGPRHQVPGMVDRGEVRDYADLAQLGYVTRARITQIMNLLHLAPDIDRKS